MTKKQEEKIKQLLNKYNDILLVTMKLAIAEDFTNLIILNKDDSEFELNSLLKNKEQYSNYIMREFLKQNSSSITKELSSMDEKKFSIRKKATIK